MMVFFARYSDRLSRPHSPTSTGHARAIDDDVTRTKTTQRSFETFRIHMDAVGNRSNVLVLVPSHRIGRIILLR